MHTRQTRIYYADHVLSIQGPHLVIENHDPNTPPGADLIVGELDSPRLAPFRAALDQLDSAARDLLMVEGLIPF